MTTQMYGTDEERIAARYVHEVQRYLSAQRRRDNGLYLVWDASFLRDFENHLGISEEVQDAWRRSFMQEVAKLAWRGQHLGFFPEYKSGYRALYLGYDNIQTRENAGRFWDWHPNQICDTLSSHKAQLVARRFLKVSPLQ